MGKLGELELLKMDYETKKREFDFYKIQADLRGYDNLAPLDQRRFHDSISELKSLNFKIHQYYKKDRR